MTYPAAFRAGTPLSSDDRCRAQLARILRSPDFDATDRERRFLEYIIEETLAGRGNRIKAYTIAVGVFGRDSAFDPQNDPIVRIAASHLRRALERYYLMAPTAEDVFITVPKGSYVPTFSVLSPSDADAPGEASGKQGISEPSTDVATPARQTPSDEDVRAQVERIVSSPEFHSAGRGATFLTYIVEETLAGRAQRIKGYSLAIEVFKRDESFTQDDPVVRIEAARLRRALERYYLVAGQRDPLRIDVPKGGYVPVFRWNTPLTGEAEPVAAPDAIQPATVARWRYSSGLIAGLMAVIAVMALAYWIVDRPGSVSFFQAGTALEADGPTLVVAPFANLGEGPNAALYAQGITEELLTALPRFKEINVFGRETSKSLSPDVDVSQVRTELGAGYLLAGGVRASGHRIRVTVRLLDTSDGAILWAQDYDDDLQSRDLFAIQTDIANKVATAVAQPYGIMARADVAAAPPDDLSAYKCTLDFYDYRSELSVERHAEVRECLENAVALYPGYATAWAMLSITYVDEERFRFNPRAGTPTPVERALQAARRATQLDPSNTRGLQALMMALFFNRQFAESMRFGEQALATNPNDTELMGEFGTRLAIGGQWRRGATLLDRALALNPGAAGYYHGTRGLSAYMLGDYPTAVAEIKQADLQKFPLFHIVAAVIYAEAGMDEEARREGEIFVRMRPDFLPNLTAELTLRNIRPIDQTRLVSGIRKAGLPVPDDVGPGTSASSTTSGL
ncbi:adenylate cyclase [Sinorhizobium sp. RAC02]|uniref:adenylate cyclase n=1 Tax=Sinorhizobium sp. RAC02 TaxID=1842534 RepID=UPI00083D65A8|nr:adenylate cyclase [Sinorhizobium sp. RAC02]AOF93405.1 tetratricopeptide repeat family protein [Sinorhizobium sp. RAC02]